MHIIIMTHCFSLIVQDLSNISPNYDPSKPSSTPSATSTQPLTSSNGK